MKIRRAHARKLLMHVCMRASHSAHACGSACVCACVYAVHRQGVRPTLYDFGQRLARKKFPDLLQASQISRAPFLCMNIHIMYTNTHNKHILTRTHTHTTICRGGVGCQRCGPLACMWEWTCTYMCIAVFDVVQFSRVHKSNLVHVHLLLAALVLRRRNDGPADLRLSPPQAENEESHGAECQPFQAELQRLKVSKIPLQSRREGQSSEMTPHATTNRERRRPIFLSFPFSPSFLPSTQAGQNRKRLGRLLPLPVAV